MSIFKGEKLNIEIFGESHSERIGAKVSGFPKMEIDFENLEKFLSRRRPNLENYSTKRREKDKPIFSKLTDNGAIDGDFTVEIENKDVKSSDYDDLYAKPRPSHADYTRYLKEGELNYTGGGRFSGRLTAPFCVVGGLLKQYLKKNYGVEIFAYLSSVGKVKGKSYKDGEITIRDFDGNGDFPALSNQVEMLNEIKRVSAEGDSVGAVLECIVFGMPTGVGNDLFGGLESKMAYTLYAIPGVKGVEFGYGFDLAQSVGSQSNDQLRINNGKVEIVTNKAGGINGGISNGNPITLSVGFRPTPSISKLQNTIDLEKMQNTQIEIKGRHDSCFAVRAVPVVESAVAIAIADALLGEEK